MKTKLILALTLAAFTSTAAMFTNIPLSTNTVHDYWWTNASPPAEIVGSNAWHAADYMFGQISNAFNAAQTPWTSDIDAGEFALHNVSAITGIGGAPIEGTITDAEHASQADGASSAGYAELLVAYGVTNVIVRSLDGGETVEFPIGVLTGDGGGLSNVLAVFASNATVATNNPAGQAIAGLSGLQMFTGSICATGAQYIAVSNGAARVLLTNGTITMSGKITSGSTIEASSDIYAGGIVKVGNRMTLYSPTTDTLRLSSGNDVARGITGLSFGSVTSSNATILHFGGTNMPATGVPLLKIVNGTNGPADLIVAGAVTTSNGFVSSAVGPFTILTNATAPADILVIKRWVTVTNQSDGSVWKMPLYQ